MSGALKGNFKTKKTVDVPEKAGQSLEERFEKEALKHLGGSICYVAKKTVKWDLDETGE